MLKYIVNRWPVKCADTGLNIPKSEGCLYDTDSKKCFKLIPSLEGATAKKWRATQEQEHEARCLAAYIEDQENAYFERYA